MNKFLKLVLLSSMMLPGVVAMETPQDSVIQADQIMQQFSECKDFKIKFTEEGKIREFISEKGISDEYMNDLLKLDLSELWDLNFSDTNISSNAIHALAKAIKLGGTPKLNYLDLSCCDIDYGGVNAIVKAVIKAVKSNNLFRMDKLWLAENDLSKEQENHLYKKLVKAVTKNSEKFSNLFFIELFDEQSDSGEELSQVAEKNAEKSSNLLFDKQSDSGEKLNQATEKNLEFFESSCDWNFEG